MRYTCGINRKEKEAGRTRVRFYVLILTFDYKEEYTINLSGCQFSD